MSPQTPTPKSKTLNPKSKTEFHVRGVGGLGWVEVSCLERSPLYPQIDCNLGGLPSSIGGYKGE